MCPLRRPRADAAFADARKGCRRRRLLQKRLRPARRCRAAACIFRASGGGAARSPPAARTYHPHGFCADISRISLFMYLLLLSRSIYMRLFLSTSYFYPRPQKKTTNFGHKNARAIAFARVRWYNIVCSGLYCPPGSPGSLVGVGSTGGAFLFLCCGGLQFIGTLSI